MKEISGIDVFAGAGGMTLGAIEAGVNVKFAIENDLNACKTYSKNFNKVQLFRKDIRLLKNVPIKRKSNEQLVVFGGPPCQGFSTSNQKTRNIKNENNWLFQEFFRIIQLNKPYPEWVVFENVKGFSETENGVFLEKVIKSLEDIGYKISYSKLNAVKYGIPQKRTRFFIVGSLNGINFEFPNDNKDTPITVKEALYDLPALENGSIDYWKEYKCEAISAYAKELRGSLRLCPNNQVTKNSNLVLERYKHIPQGGNWQQIPEHLMLNYKDFSRCHTGIYYRLKEDEASIVIGNYRKNMLIHPIENRGLSVREAARLQSFPDNFEFVGSIGFQQQQVGNAVPPKLARKVFEKIITYL